MTNGNDRLDRIERILEEGSKRQAEFVAESANRHARFEEELATRHARFEEEAAKRNQEFAARQQYHDEAFERHDAELKRILEAISVDAENIRALARIAELHQHRMDQLDGGEPA